MKNGTEEGYGAHQDYKRIGEKNTDVARNMEYGLQTGSS